VIGATYVDCGLDAASALVHRLFDPVIARSALLGAGLDWKTSLQELTAVRGLGVPDYHVEDTGPDHQKLFRAVVRVGGRDLGSGEGRSKKAAEQQAAQAAYEALHGASDNAGAPRTAPPDVASSIPPQPSPANPGADGTP
jgi:ribonuclease-3